VLLTVEVALSVMLLLGAGLILRTFSHLNAVELGFEAENVQLFALGLGGDRYDDPDTTMAFFESLEVELAVLPGVEAVGSAFGTPMGSNRVGGSMVLLDRPRPQPGQEDVALWHAVSPGYFEALRIPVLHGRNFDRTDRIDAQRVVIISESFARRYYPDDEPLGKQIEVQVSFGYAEDQPRTVVGVVGDVRTAGLTRDPQPELYVPVSQSGPNFLSLAVRAAPGVDVMPTAREVVRRLDPDVPPRWVETLESVVDRALGPTRFYAMLLISFAGVALVLAAIGLYGVVGYLVAQRTPEIAVRMALGADRGRVVRMVFAQGAWPIIVGVILGLVGAQVTARIISSLLHGVEATDPASAAASTGLLLATAFLALLVPAIRASRIAPMTALKQE
jgi:putative ABC transport system permease protein